MITTKTYYTCKRPYCILKNAAGHSRRYWVPATIRNLRASAKKRRALAEWEAERAVEFRDEDFGNILQRALQVKIDKGRLRHGSQVLYRGELAIYEKWLTGRNLKPENVTRRQASEFLQEVSRTRGQASALNFKTCLCALYNVLVDDETLLRNPFSRQALTGKEVERNTAIADADRAALEAELAKWPELRLMTRFVFRTFIRPAELCRLTWAHVDLNAGTIRIPASVSKNRRAGVVTIPDDFCAEIRAHVAAHAPAPDVRLFHRAPTLSQQHRRCVQSAGLAGRGYTLYSWKHTGACALYRASRDVMLVSKHCRHSTVKTTERYLRDLGIQTEAVRVWST